MDDFSSLFKKENMGQLVLGILFIIYLIMGMQMPEPIANVVDTLVGKVVIFIIVIYLFINANPLLAVLSLFVAYDLIRRSSQTTGLDALEKYAPSEKKKTSQFTAYNQFPYTLEQEVVSKMAPIKNSGNTMSNASYKPTLENTYDASSVTNAN
jgi:hypothetical protein